MAGQVCGELVIDPEMEEIMDRALSSHQLAEKAGIELEQARRITSVNSVQASRQCVLWPICGW